jgi:hypothetical protein
MNEIPALQNQEEALKLLRARTRVYSSATRIMVIQVVLTVLLPFASAFLTLFWPNIRAVVALTSLVIVIADPLVMDRRYKVLTERAAKIAEQFDCKVLDIPWDHFTVGEMLEAEDIYTAARSYAKRHDDSKLLNWYPTIVGSVTLHLARIICQRTNLRYDSQLRRSYSVLLFIMALVVVSGLFIFAFVQKLSVEDWVLSMTPATPVLAWAFREYYRQRDTASFLEDLMVEAKKLWDQALAGSCEPDECKRKSREFQNAIYLRRSTSPLVIPGLYRMKRTSLEDEMNEGAAAFLRQLRDSSNSDS